MSPKAKRFLGLELSPPTMVRVSPLSMRMPRTELLSLSAMASSVARVTDFKPVHLEEIGPHYVRTLRAWTERLLQNREQVRERGYSDELLRAWLFYLGYCEAGFAEKYLGDVQILLAKPGARYDAATLTRAPEVLA